MITNIDTEVSGAHVHMDAVVGALLPCLSLFIPPVLLLMRQSCINTGPAG